MNGKLILSLLIGVAVFLAVQADHHDHDHEMTMDEMKAKIKGYVDKTPADQLADRIQKGIDYLVGGGARPAHLPAAVDHHVAKMSQDERQELADYLKSFLH
ncbi:hypothetical protein HELRODRAFT_191758 [Helobdella robusta]|uniref:Uncharacterized protein n=1 Tax=Helobdella robusta TaxID=6412 RepID=T1FTA2_HELRO|nr:hypothetical protein HELRODRAFT_191758 [Helobdella robusta]ESO04313.1 hypothetical protein HELRODRAFT_191758 [Helobdella robusta]